MAKIKLGARPANFKRTVKVTMLDGTIGTVDCTFKYRTRTEFGAFIDEITEAAGVKPVDADAKFSFKELMDKTKGSNSDFIMKVVDDWDLEAEFSRESVEQLCDTYPGAATEIMDTYRTAILEGKVKN